MGRAHGLDVKLGVGDASEMVSMSYFTRVELNPELLCRPDVIGSRSEGGLCPFVEVLVFWQPCDNQVGDNDDVRTFEFRNS